MATRKMTLNGALKELGAGRLEVARGLLELAR